MLLQQLIMRHESSTNNYIFFALKNKNLSYGFCNAFKYNNLVIFGAVVICYTQQSCTESFYNVAGKSF